MLFDNQHGLSSQKKWTVRNLS